MQDKDAFRQALSEGFSEMTDFPANRFHPLVWIHGAPDIGERTAIGAMSEVNAKGAQVTIGADCDIASFVAINCADSHKRCLGMSEHIERRDISIGHHVFIGSHCLVKGGAVIGDYCVIAAGTIVDAGVIPDYSLVYGNPMQVRAGYYRDKVSRG
ncbi:acyltransferase [Chromobacterium phragmitis]|uniref:Acyltransferase n=1 Tax=Chromobacterium phragmitis TaxID=2202141 RepID=A0A344UH44_9NEIS|nr:DapH/DapD/GlmU-related protein [Chromobacterium phragmitis]AXE29233.1 acyltransferase [Chromobacterium phragmitis]AXE34592.1 acyltransferase [Chromobacterium phragmitis]